jgi:hypothetical protein
MAKININSIDWEEEAAGYEKFTKSNRKKTPNEEDILQSQGKFGRGRKGDSFISQRTKARR